jgi:class 3 adenylate cyclase
VAVTGLPDKQEYHAVIMVKFARDCYAKLTQLLPSLAEKLGPDTLSLAFRVGLHSGPVTGGVLRGQKSRFQLFGDTINTASRMESNGVAGRIHISQATADELKAKGMGKWVEPRKDKIEAKGKGLMQTYFVNVHRAARSVVSTATFNTNESGTSDQQINYSLGGSSRKEDRGAIDGSTASEGSTPADDSQKEVGIHVEV